jgi:hypothetical protein
VALELLDLLARAHIPQPNAVVVRPTDELPRIRRVELKAGDAFAAIFSNVRFTDTALRLSPAERGEGVGKTVTVTVDRAELATFRKMWSPVALELLDLLARAHIPQPNAVVPRPSDELPRIRWVELDAGDAIAAIFSNVRFTDNCSTPLPR